ncbi:hypothetical protein BDN71DRAFT_1393603, partial [Pleurotus eryngii]
PCLWQVSITLAILHHDEDIIFIAGTGMGKTLTFWLPLLLCPDGIQIVVTPLNILGKQNVEFIEDIRYQAIVISPGQLMKPGGKFEKLLLNSTFISHIISIILDEGHCIST